MDKLVIIDVFRNQGLGTNLLKQFEEKMRQKGYEIICLKAHPIIQAKYGLIVNVKKKQINFNKHLIQNFYFKNGYEFPKKRVDYMYKIIK